jgi:hypothetical protein
LRLAGDPGSAFLAFRKLVTEERDLFDRLCRARGFDEMAVLAVELGRERGYVFGVKEIRNARMEAARVLGKGEGL